MTYVYVKMRSLNSNYRRRKILNKEEFISTAMTQFQK